MPEPKVVFFLGAGASAFMGLPTTEPLMTSFIDQHRTCNIGSMIKNYNKRNIEDLYSDVNELLSLHKNMVLPHIPILCATDKVIDNIADWDNVDHTSQTLSDEQLLCDEHPSLESSQSESYFESVHNMLEHLKHSLGEHVFESLEYNKTKLSDYCTVIERLRIVAGSLTTDIITTNYDVLIENCCDNLNLQIIDGFSKMPSGKGKWDGKFSGIGDIKLLKLHGSLNWHKESDETPVRESTEMQYNPTRSIWIEPAPQKEGTDEEPLKTIREEFKKILRDCDLLVVIGCSFNDEIWKDIIYNEIGNDGHKMRLLYISKSIDNFSGSYDFELIVNELGHVDYKSKSRSSRKTQNKHSIGCFESEFDTKHIDDIIKVIEQAKTYSRIDMKSR